MIGVADHPELLLALVGDPQANESARGAALQAWGRRALDSALPAAEVRDRLARVYEGLWPEREPFLIAELGIAAAFFGLANCCRPQVAQALACQPGGVFAVYSLRGFDRDLECQAAEGSRALMDRIRWVPFKGTAVDELSGWHAFRQDRPTGRPAGGGNHNACRNVGRNEPCPCGSGHDIKKCFGAA